LKHLAKPRWHRESALTVESKRGDAAKHIAP
jgi:hypothetical protein